MRKNAIGFPMAFFLLKCFFLVLMAKVFTGDWLFVSKGVTQKRNSSYDLPLEELANTFGGGDPAQILDAQLLGQAIDTYLGTIDREARALFLRRYWFGDSVKALAKDFGISQNTASVRLSRTRKQLKDYLHKEGLL